MHYFLPSRFVDKAALALVPPQDRLVTVEFTPEGKTSLDSRSVAASTKGYAEYQGRADDTYPHAVHPGSLSDKYSGYSSAEALQANYSASFTNALGVTGFIAESLDRTHGVQTDTKELDELQKAWQKVSPQEMHPKTAVLLPKRAK